MLMPPFELHHPSSVDEAVQLAADLMEKGEAFDWVAAERTSSPTTNGASIRNLT